MNLKNIKIPENSLFIKTLLWLLFILIFTLSFFSEGSTGGADTYVRYFFTKESWNSPYLLMDFWSKPVYTLLASPFAQFGYNGIKVFNILLGILSAYAAFRIAKNYGIRFRVAVIFIILFAPIYISMMMTAMTEVLFGAILITGIWLYTEKKYLWSAVLISFIIHVRTEGMIFLLLWAILFVINKKYKQIPFLLTGFVIYGIIGMFYVYHDFFWIFTQNIYVDNIYDYGSGPLLYYVNGYEFIFGTYLTILVVLGLIVYLFILIRSILKKNFLPVFTEASLIAGIPLLYFVMHSVFWWKGWFHVLGDVRFMAAIIPITGLIAIKGIDFIFNKVQNGFYIALLTILTIIPAVNAPFCIYTFPVPHQGENEVMNKAINWLKTTPYFSNRILFYNPVVPILLDRDPFKDTTLLSGIITAANIDSMKVGDILIWDSHFAGAERMISEENLISNNNFELIRSFRPEIPLFVYNGEIFQISVFKKTSDELNQEKKFVFDTLHFNNYNDKNLFSDLIEIPKSTGNLMLPLNKTRIYSPSFDTSLSDFNDKILFVKVKVDIWLPSNIETKVFLVASIENNGISKQYACKTIEGDIKAGLHHLEINDHYYLPDLKNMWLRVYAYTADSQEVFIDNLLIMKKIGVNNIE